MTTPVPSIPPAAPASAESFRPPRPDRTGGQAFSPVLSQAQLRDDHRAVPANQGPRPTGHARDRAGTAERERRPYRSDVGGEHRPQATDRHAQADRRRSVDRRDRQHDGDDDSSEKPGRSETATDDSARPEGKTDASASGDDRTGEDGLDGIDGEDSVAEQRLGGAGAELGLPVDRDTAPDGGEEGVEPVANVDDPPGVTNRSEPGVGPATTVQPMNGGTPVDSSPSTNGHDPTEAVASGEAEATELAAAQAAQQSGANPGSESGGAGRVDDAATTGPRALHAGESGGATPATETATSETDPPSFGTDRRSNEVGRPDGGAPPTTTTESSPQSLDREQDTAAAAVPGRATAPTSSIETTGTAPHRISTDLSAPGQPGVDNTAAIDGLTTAPTDGLTARIEVAAGSVESHTEALDGEAADELWGQVQRALNRIRTGPEGTELRLRLHPAELGELLIQVRAQGEQLSVRLVTSSAAAHQTLLADQQRLAEELSEAGFTDGSVDIGEWGAGTSRDGRSSGHRQERAPGSDLSPPDGRRPTPTTSDRAPTDATPAVARSGDGRPLGGLVDVVL